MGEEYERIETHGQLPSTTEKYYKPGDPEGQPSGTIINEFRWTAVNRGAKIPEPKAITEGISSNLIGLLKKQLQEIDGIKDAKPEEIARLQNMAIANMVRNIIGNEFKNELLAQGVSEEAIKMTQTETVRNIMDGPLRDLLISRGQNHTQEDLQNALRACLQAKAVPESDIINVQKMYAETKDAPPPGRLDKPIALTSGQWVEFTGPTEHYNKEERISPPPTPAEGWVNYTAKNSTAGLKKDRDVIRSR